MDCIPLIDFSLEDDFLIPSYSHGLENNDFFNNLGALSNAEAANIERASTLIEQVSELTDSPQKKGKPNRFSLRKSLAWDSEFFTSEGVLNAEELAIFNSTYNKASTYSLPRIHEELTKSVESTSTSHSGSKKLENLKCSVQRPLTGSNRTTNMGHMGKPKEQHKPNIPHPKTLKKLDFSSQTKFEPSTPTALSKQRTSRQPQKSTNSGGHADAKWNASGNGQAISRSVNKTPEISSTSCSLPGLGGKPLKINDTKDLPEILTGKRQTSLYLTKPNKDSRMASLRTPTKNSIIGTPQSCFKMETALCSSASYSVSKSASKNTIHFPPNLSIKASTRAKNKLLSSNSSPASSIDSFLSESSSQASSCTKHSSSFKFSTGNNPSKKLGSLAQSFNGNHSKSSPSFDSDAKGATTLGLRTPRPRVGYFDKEKIVANDYSKRLQTSLRSSHGNSETPTNRGKLSHLPSTRVAQLISSEGNYKGSVGHPIRIGSKVPSNFLQPKFEQRVHEQALLMKARAAAAAAVIVSKEKENLCPTHEGALGQGTLPMLEEKISFLSLQ